MGDLCLSHLRPDVYDVLYDISIHENKQNKKASRSTLRTLNAAQYGIPMGKLANTANALFALTPLNARLCVISWMDRKRLWFAVPPMT
jgi:hypothetical protein